MTQDASNILEYVIQITEQRDAELLEVSLAQTLQDIFSAEMVLFCKTRGLAKTLYCTVSVDVRGFSLEPSDGKVISFLKKWEEACLESIATGKSARAAEGNAAILVYPVILLQKAIGALLIQVSDDTVVDHALINGFLKIYHNYITLLAESQHDKLTGLLNRKTFDDRIMKIIEFKKNVEKSIEPGDSRRRRVDSSLGFWLGIFDIDDFKKINDTFGHVYGDEVLILVSRLVVQTFRSDDLLFRYGGEEFVVIMRARTEREAIDAFERLRKNIEEHKFPNVDRVTISIGMIQITTGVVPTTFVGHADQALYYAKKHGKNRVCVYEDLVKEGLITPEQKFGRVELF